MFSARLAETDVTAPDRDYGIPLGSSESDVCIVLRGIDMEMVRFFAVWIGHEGHWSFRAELSAVVNLRCIEGAVFS